MSSVAVIIPTTGAPLVRECLASVLAQTHADLRPHIVVDGPEYATAFANATAGLDLSRCKLTVLGANVGRDGFYGHRVYAAWPHLVDADYVAFLDQDNTLEPEHLHTLVQAIEAHQWDWAFALRRVFSEAGSYLIDDESQSIGPWGQAQPMKLVDTNCYCLRTAVAQRMASFWHGQWGQDRVFYTALAQNFANFGCTGQYTLNYRTRDNLQPRVMALLQRENAVLRAAHPAGLPWVGRAAGARLAGG